MNYTEKPARVAHGTGSVNTLTDDDNTGFGSQLDLDLVGQQRTATPLHRRTDPETSRIAAERFTRSGDRDSMKARILNFMRENPSNRTSAEIARDGGFDRVGVARRMSDMERDHLVERYKLAV